MKGILAFDAGIDIVGILDLCTDTYTPFRGQRMIDGARMVFECEGIVISFNGTLYDLPELAKLTDIKEPATALRGTHHDMQIKASEYLWAPYPGEERILGPDLKGYYGRIVGKHAPVPPSHLDLYEQDNWLDCRMTADLWLMINYRLAHNV